MLGNVRTAAFLSISKRRVGIMHYPLFFRFSWLYKSWYTLQFFNNSACVPIPTILPPSNTIILLASCAIFTLYKNITVYQRNRSKQKSFLQCQKRICAKSHIRSKFFQTANNISLYILCNSHNIQLSHHIFRYLLGVLPYFCWNAWLNVLWLSNPNSR